MEGCWDLQPASGRLQPTLNFGAVMPAYLPVTLQGRKPGPPFTPKKDDDQNIDSMLGQMEVRGEGWDGTIYHVS